MPSSSDTRTLPGRISMPLVSVIVPSYNHARFVIACLNSVLADPYPAKELVVIDDGSTDGSDELIRRWVEEHPDAAAAVRFAARPNRGQTATLNELVATATGEYVAYVASDDMLEQGGLGARVAYLESHPDKHAVFGDCRVVDAEGQPLMESGLADLHGVRKERLKTALSAEIVGNWGVPGPVLMYRRQAMLDISGYEPSHIIEDWNVYLGFVRRGWLGFIDDVVGIYRFHGENTMSQPERQQKIAADRLDTALRHLPHLRLVDRYRMVQQICSIKGALAKAQGKRARWLMWRAIAGALKLPILTLDPIADRATPRR
jgi:glycosyltransferase involved in cell wall biosynthesis